MYISEDLKITFSVLLVVMLTRWRNKRLYKSFYWLKFIVIRHTERYTFLYSST